MTISKPDDFDTVLHAVQTRGLLLQYASTRLRNNPEIVRAAVFRDPSALKHTSKELLTNKLFILSLFNQITSTNFHAESILGLLPRKFKNDKDIVLAAVTKYGFAIREASVELKNVKRIALAAIENQPLAFKEISAALKNNFEIAYEAVCLDHSNLLSLNTTSLSTNTTIIYESVYLHPDSYYFLSKKMQNNRVVNYIYSNAEHIETSEWPVVKEALQMNPELVLKPPAPITAIFTGATLPYLAIANYALNHDVVFTEVESFDFI